MSNQPRAGLRGSRAENGAMRDDLIPVRLVPVEVFGTDQCCEHNPHGALDAPDCPSQGYGLSDAVSAWSDCNRAVGHIYRFDDIDQQYRNDGETLVVWADPEQYRAFAERRFDSDGARRSDDECAEKHCEEPATLGLTIRYADDLRVEIYLCERHFDAMADHV